MLRNTSHNRSFNGHCLDYVQELINIKLDLRKPFGVRNRDCLPGQEVPASATAEVPPPRCISSVCPSGPSTSFSFSCKVHAGLFRAVLVAAPPCRWLRRRDPGCWSVRISIAADVSLCFVSAAAPVRGLHPCEGEWPGLGAPTPRQSWQQGRFREFQQRWKGQRSHKSCGI